MTILVLMGVSGSGKTTVGRKLADALGWPFQEGDALHPPANVAKMAAGSPLTDEDRWPWLAAITAVIDTWRTNETSGVLTCSALRRAYRSVLTDGGDDVRLVFLRGDPPMIAERMAARQGHFMPPTLLASQFATLEPPDIAERAITLDTTLPPDALVGELQRRLQHDQS